MNKTKGFSLLEVITAIGVLTVLFALGINIFSSVIKGSDKATTLTEINENGSTIIETFNRTVRSASAVRDCATANTLDVWDQDQSTYSRLRLTTGNFKKSNGASCTVIGTDCFAVNYMELSTQCNPTSGVCAATSKLGNTHPQSGVNIQSVSFSCSPAANPSVVAITVTVQQGVTRTSNEADTVQTFKTSAEVRKY